MKHPVLHVKKGVPVYDDSLEEREAPRRAAEPVSRFRAGKGRRRGRLAFLPLLILALALVFVFRFIPRKPPNVAVLAGWEAVLRAAPHEGAVLAGVTFKRAAGDPVPETPPIALVRFFCPQTGERQAVFEALARSPYTIHVSMKDSPAVRIVQAEVVIGDQKKFLAVVPRRAR
jgi:hypothetical protein